jgi:DNA polymerase epsilon subunit 4
MENPNKPEESQNLNSINMIEESKVSEQEIKNNSPIIKEEKIIINDNELKQINNNIENNQTEEMALNEMNIEKNSENNQIEQNSIKDINENEDTKKEKTSLIRYPLAKIKNIIKLDSDVKLVQKDAYIIIGKLTELFLQDLAQGAYNICKSCKRKTINLEDINSAIKMNLKMGFINFNSIFYVQELNKIKKRPNSTKKSEKKIEKEKGGDNDDNSIKKEKKKENNEMKKRGKSTKTKNNNSSSFNNMTLDSMFQPKN